MQSSPLDYLSIKDILADVIVMVGDEDKTKLSTSYYSRTCRNVLEEMNFHTFFIEGYEDFDMPSDLIMPYPKWAWNLKDMFVYDVDTTETTDACSNEACCIIGDMQRVLHKTNYLSAGKDLGYTSRNHGNNIEDLFIRNFSTESDILFYNVQNGLVMLSDSCKDFDKIRIVANGLTKGNNLEETNIIPRFIREAMVLAVTVKAARAIYGKGIEPQRYRTLWLDSKNDLYGQPTRTSSSVWDEALYRLKRRDTKELDDLKVYLGKMPY